MDIKKDIQSSIQSLQLDSAEDSKDEERASQPAPVEEVKQEEAEKVDTIEEDVESEVQASSHPVHTEPKVKEKETAAPHDFEEVDTKDVNKKRHLNAVFIGHVDAGKSTGGQILSLSGQMDDRTIQEFEKEAKDKSRESWYMAYIMDTNEGRVKGHKSYVPNMISGASQTDIGVLVISARKGEFKTGYERGGQTREHDMLAKTLGVSKLLVVVNKMDDPTKLWSKERYDEIESKMTPFLKSLGYNVKKDVQFLPIFGQLGTNMKTRLDKSVCPWWDGSCLFEVMDVIEVPLRDPKGLVSSLEPRWKENGSEAIALAHPMSKIIVQLQSSLIQSETQGLLSGCDVLLNVGPEETGLLLRSSFGRPVITADKDKQWYQINFEEAFYMCHFLKCLNIVEENKCPKKNDEVWEYMRSKRKSFPEFYKAYFHLRAKNWVVKSASQYGVDFVAYHHHPSLVHSEYAVVVLSESDGDLDTNVRLRVWSDIHGTVRLGDSVAKTLLILNIKKNGCDEVSPSCLDQFIVEERTITRWNPKQCQEDLTLVKSFKFSSFSSSLSKAERTIVVDFSVLSPGLSQVSTVPPSLKGPRWKGKGSKAIALAHPMSKIIAQLQSSLIQSETQGLLSGCDVLLNVGAEETNLLLCSSLGRPIVTANEDKQGSTYRHGQRGYQINLEEAFYMCHSLKCLNIVGENKCLKNNDQLWEYMRSKRKSFPEFYKAYSHLRKKNWVVRSGSQYGVDYVAYRHHLSLVHSEYAVLVLSEGDDDLDTNVRLRVWSDIQSTVRLCGNVVKILLVLKIKKNGCDAVSPSCLDQYTVEEQTITRWNPKQCREEKLVKGGIH